MMFSSPLSRRDAWALLAAIGLAVAAYVMSMGYGFTHDDISIITQQPQLVVLSNWKDILVATWWPDALYRPVTRISFAIDWTVGGGHPQFLHVVNVALHAAVTALVFLLVRVPLGTVGAGVAAALFAAHPVHVEAVASVVGRAEILATLFAVAAALLYHWDGVLADARDEGWRRYVASFGTLTCLVLGVASKESALAIPGILIIVDWLDGSRNETPVATRVARHAVLWFGSVALSVLWLGFRAAVIGDYVGDWPSPGL
ncbi:MAG: hypothetical protein IIA27_10865, partial [Gemmatimonadetes bacterium]|nr:hypothetical protein [Gemmatimonadota bacterium]